MKSNWSMMASLLPSMMASYEDEFVKTPNGWRFAKRVVRGQLSPRPAPR